ncbi:MAG: hypothetical protein JW738_02795 [Actinobacteria bacterium]|nr:hypothetical protein [Actinomycetota bacterium]
MKCPQCGAINEDNSDFCNLCYYQFQQSEGYAEMPADNYDPAEAQPGDTYEQFGSEENPEGPVEQYDMGPGEGYPEDTTAFPPDQYGTGPGEGYPQDQYGTGPGEGYPADTPGMPANQHGVSSSDAFGQYGGEAPGSPADPYGAPPGDIYGQWSPASRQQEARVKRKLPVGRIVGTTLTMLVIGGVAAAAIFLLVPRIFTNRVGYSSSVSNLTFKYPSDWHAMSVNEVGRVSELQLSDFDNFNEALLSDAVSTDNDYLLRSLSIPDISNQTFQNRRRDLKKAIVVSANNEIDPGTERPAIVFEDTNVYGNPAFTTSFDYIKGGRKYQMNIAVIHNGTTEYYIYLMGFGDTDARDLFNEILESITFRG